MIMNVNDDVSIDDDQNNKTNDNVYGTSIHSFIHH